FYRPSALACFWTIHSTPQLSRERIQNLLKSRIRRKNRYIDAHQVIIGFFCREFLSYLLTHIPKRQQLVRLHCLIPKLTYCLVTSEYKSYWPSLERALPLSTGANGQ